MTRPFAEEKLPISGESNDGLLLPDMELDLWDCQTRLPRRRRLFLTLFKRLLLLNLRRPSFIVEFVAANVVWTLVIPIWLGSRVFRWPGRQPRMVFVDREFGFLEEFATWPVPAIFGPNCDATRYLVSSLNITIGSYHFDSGICALARRDQIYDLLGRWQRRWALLGERRLFPVT
jgi:hypothetical protein